MHARRPADEDRLPWLEPYKETKLAAKPKPPRRRRSRKPLLAGAAAILFAAVGAGGYWLGQQTEGEQPQVSQTVEIAPVRPSPRPVEIAQAPEAAPVAEPVASGPRPKAKSGRKAAHHRSAPRRKIRTAGVEREHIDAVHAQQERAAEPEPKPEPKVMPKPVARQWPKMPSPGPAGQVIQLGAFTTPARAHSAYSNRVARYPLLGRLPRVVVPVVTKPGNRVLYVLRLGTGSRQQSKMVCRNLQRSGDHCLVIG